MKRQKNILLNSFLHDKKFYLFLLIGIFLIIYNILANDIHNETTTNYSILCKDNQIINKKEAGERNKYLLEIFLQHISTTTQLEVNHQQIRMQVKLFYAAILSALITAAILAVKKSRWIWIVVFITSILMYGLDTHLKDIGIRLHNSAKIVDNTRTELLNISENDTTYYSLNYKVLGILDNYYSKSRYYRKIQLAIEPDIEQIIYYYFPMILSWMFFIKTSLVIKRKKRLTSLISKESRK